MKIEVDFAVYDGFDQRPMEIPQQDIEMEMPQKGMEMEKRENIVDEEAQELVNGDDVRGPFSAELLHGFWFTSYMLFVVQTALFSHVPEDPHNAVRRDVVNVALFIPSIGKPDVLNRKGDGTSNFEGNSECSPICFPCSFLGCGCCFCSLRIWPLPCFQNAACNGNGAANPAREFLKWYLNLPLWVRALGFGLSLIFAVVYIYISP